MSETNIVEHLQLLLYQIKKEISCYEDYVSGRLKELFTSLGNILSYMDMESRRLVATEIREWITEEHVHVGVYLYSFLLYMTHEEQDLHACYEYIEKTDKLSVFTKKSLYDQLMIIMFSFDGLDTYNVRVAKWKLLQKICEGFRKKVTVPLTYIPKKDRNEGLVIVIATAILSDRIGPTRTALERSASVIRDWKKNVLLINTAEAAPFVGCIDFYEQKVGEYVPDWSSLDSITWQGIKIPFFQCDQNMPDIDTMDMLITQIRQMRPMYVLTLGGSSILANLVNNIVPVLTIGLGFSELEPTQTMFQTLSRKMGNDDKRLLGEVGLAENHVIETTFTFDLKSSNHTFTRKEMGIPDGKFILVVAGTRLDSEVPGEFLEMLDRLCENEKYFIVFAGKFQTYQEKIKPYEHITLQSGFYGYQKDMLAFFELCDLFVNPTRKGGGTMAVEAMSKGIPVVTTPYGDIAADVGEDYFVKDYEEMLMEIQHYCENGEYYAMQSEAAKQLAKRLTEDKSPFIDLLEEYKSRLLKADRELF